MIARFVGLNRSGGFLGLATKMRYREGPSLEGFALEYKLMFRSFKKTLEISEEADRQRQQRAAERSRLDNSVIVR